MLLSKEVNIRWVGKNKDYYVNKGYIFTKMNTKITVNIKDVPLNCNEYVEALCDYCKEQISKKTYQAYNKQRKTVAKDCCDKKECKIQKNLDIQKVKFNGLNPSQLEVTKKKIGDKNRKYTTQFVINKLREKNYNSIKGYIYKNINDDLPYICNKHQHLGTQNTSLAKLLRFNHVCEECVTEARRYAQNEKLFNDIKLEFERFNCNLISNFITSKKQKVEFICNLHKEFDIQEISYDKVENGTHPCLYCREVKGTSYNIVYAKRFFQDHNKTLIEDIYLNSFTPMKYICNLHPEIGHQLATMEQIKNNKFVCDGCKKDNNEKKRLRYEKKLFKQMTKSGMIPTKDARYDNIDSYIPYVCEKHLGIVQRISVKKFRIGRRCRLCAINSGENHYNYQGGISSLNNHLRGLLRPLIDKKLEEYNYKCFITGKGGTLEVHHLYNFNKIVKDVLKELNLTIEPKVENYSNKEIQAIENLFLDKHRKNWGLPILPELHDIFHADYGLKDNNVEQFFDFVEKVRYGFIDEIED